MTSPGHILLKMLEPALRPGQAGGVARPGTPPLEQRSFEELLADRMTPQGTLDEMDAPAHGQGAAGPLAALAGLGQIENASLRDLIARQAQAGQQRLPHDDPSARADAPRIDDTHS